MFTQRQKSDGNQWPLIHINSPLINYKDVAETEPMASSSIILGGGRCIKVDGHVITLYRKGLNGLQIIKVKKLVDY